MTYHMTSPLQEDPDVIEGDEEEVVMETTELTGEELLTRDYLSTVSPLHIFLPYWIANVSSLVSRLSSCTHDGKLDSVWLRG